MHLYSSLSPSQYSVVGGMDVVTVVVVVEMQSPQLSWQSLVLVRIQSEVQSDHSDQVDGQSYGVVHSLGVHVSFGLQLGSTPSTSNSTTRTGLSQVPSHFVV